MLLSTRHAVTTLANHRVISIGQALHHIEDARCPTGLIQLCVGGVGSGVPEVGAHRVVKQVGVLGDDAYPGPQVVLAQRAEVGPSRVIDPSVTS